MVLAKQDCLFCHCETIKYVQSPHYFQRISALAKAFCRFCHCGTIKHIQSPHWLSENKWSCKNNIVGFVTVRQSNMYSHLTYYQRTSGPFKATLMVSHCETIKHVQSPHWLPEDQLSCKNNIFGCVTVRQSNMYSHLTDYQRTSGPVKATLMVLSLWDNQTCTVTSMITRGPVDV